jgi:hypothetical protein
VHDIGATMNGGFLKIVFNDFFTFLTFNIFSPDIYYGYWDICIIA